VGRNACRKLAAGSIDQSSVKVVRAPREGMSANRQFRGALVIAPPSIMGTWGIELLRDAAAAMNPPLQFYLLDRLDTVDLSISSQTLYATQFPSASVLSTINDGRLPVVGFLDDAIDSVAYQRRLSGCSFMEALRAATCSVVANPTLLEGHSSIVYYRGHAVAPDRIVAQVLDHLALFIPPEGQEILKRKYCLAATDLHGLETSLAERVPRYEPQGHWSKELIDEEASIVDQVLGPLLNMASLKACAPITWPLSVFLSGDRPDTEASRVMEITGAARIIYYGPYLYLPPGRWKAEFAVGFSRDAVGSTFTVEVYGSSLIARARFRASRAGLFSGTFLFDHVRVEDHIEMRFRNDQGAIEGRVGLAWIKLHHASQPLSYSVE
jgi:hypothetical protein